MPKKLTELLEQLCVQRSSELADIDTCRLTSAHAIRARLDAINTTVNNKPYKKRSIRCREYRALVTESVLLRTKLALYEQRAASDMTRAAVCQLDGARRDRKNRRLQAQMLLVLSYSRFDAASLERIVVKYEKLLSCHLCRC